MSAVDAPPGLPFSGRAAGEFVARPRSLKLARRATWFIVVASAISLFVVGRNFRFLRIGTESRLVAPLVAVAIALVCLAVRRARLRIDGAGVRWGWDSFGFRVVKDGLSGATIYQDAVGFRRPRGSPWYLGRHDFDDFDRIPAALRQAKIPFEVVDRRAPFRARMQTYGLALDILIVLDILFAALTLFLAFGAR